MAYWKNNSPVNPLASGDLIPLSRGTSDKAVDADNLIAHLTTADLTEDSSNKYYTDERVDDRVSSLIQNGTGISWSYNDGAGTLTPTVSLSSFTTANLAATATIGYSYKAPLTIDDTTMKSLNASPQTIVTGQPSQQIVITGATIKSDNVTTGYTNNGIDLVDSTTGNILFSVPAASISGTTPNTVYVFMPVGTGVAVTLGGNVSVKANTSDPTGGNAANSTKVIVHYVLSDYN